MIQYQWWIDNVPEKERTFDWWLGDVNNVSRKWFRNFLVNYEIESVLDVACGTGRDYEGVLANNIDVEYYGMDISDYLVAKNRDRGMQCFQGNIEDIPELDDSWDLVYARHIIEHLEYYETAIEEMCRVAKRYVLIVHFIPMESEDRISITQREDGEFHENAYGHDKFVKFCSQFGQVQRIDLNDLVQKQTLTLITLK